MLSWILLLVFGILVVAFLFGVGVISGAYEEKDVIELKYVCEKDNVIYYVEV